MQIIEWGNFLKQGLPLNNNSAAMTVGFFDGVHRGHRALIDRIVLQTRQEGGFSPVIITFRKKNNANDIYSFRQKIECFREHGIAFTVVADLTKTFMQKSGKEFLKLLKERGKMGFLAIGSNFCCGHNRDTDAQTVKKINAESGIPTEIIEVIAEEGIRISSSRIREAIISGNLGEAAAMLGRPVVLDITAPGLVLPPDGWYKVLLYDKNGGKKTEEIHIDNRTVNPGSFSKLDFIEFLA